MYLTKQQLPKCSYLMISYTIALQPTGPVKDLLRPVSPVKIVNHVVDEFDPNLSQACLRHLG